MNGNQRDTRLRLGCMHVAHFFELKRQPVAQRALWAQLFDQLFRAFEGGRFVIATLVENLTPTTRNLLFG